MGSSWPRSSLLLVTTAILGAFSLSVAVSGCAGRSRKSETTPENKGRLLLAIAEGNLSEGDPTAALQVLASAEKLLPNDPALFHARAIAYFQKNMPDKAIASVRTAVRLNPNYTEALTTLGRLELEAGQLTEAEAHLKKAAADELYEDSFKPCTSLGILYYKRNRIAEAETWLNRAIESTPRSACVAYYYRGHIEMKRSQVQEAIKDYTQASQLPCSGGFSEAGLALGIAFERAKQYDAARKEFVQIQQRYPTSASADEAMRRLRYLP